MSIDEAAAILIVENEPLIAMDVEDMLRSAGFVSIRHVSSVGEAEA